MNSHNPGQYATTLSTPTIMALRQRYIRLASIRDTPGKKVAKGESATLARIRAYGELSRAVDEALGVTKEIHNLQL